MRSSPLLLVLAAITLLSVSRSALAGSGGTGIALVNLDENATSKRFGKLKAGLDAVIKKKSEKDYGVIATRVLDKKVLGAALKPDCALGADAALEQKLYDDDNVGFVLLYCSTGEAPNIRVALFRVAGHLSEIFSLRLVANNGSVGAQVFSDIALTVHRFAETWFSP